MRLEMIMPTVLIGGMALAAIGYAVVQDWPKVGYWAAAAVLNASITYF